MKKIYCFFMILTLLPSLLLPSKASEYLTKAEVGELINKAVEMYEFFHLDPWNKAVDYDQSKHISVDFYHYRYREYQTGKQWYHLVIDESKFPGGSYEALPEYTRSIYTEDIADSMYNTCARSFYDLDVPMFYASESGELYLAHDIGYDWTEVAPWYYGINKYNDQFTVDNIDIVYADSEKATVRYLTRLDRNEALYYGWVECYLVNTDDGWRITDSPFTKMLRYERYAKELWEPYVIRYEDYKESPSTGDPAFGLFVLLPVVSLACLVPAVCLLRRRRRTVA